MSRWNFFLIIFQPLSVHEHETIKRYLIGSLVDFKGRYLSVVPALEAELLYLYRYLRQRYTIIPLLQALLLMSKKNLPIFPSTLSTGVNL
jgi:hypothetical protein